MIRKSEILVTTDLGPEGKITLPLPNQEKLIDDATKHPIVLTPEEEERAILTTPWGDQRKNRTNAIRRDLRGAQHERGDLQATE
jgi:hypothetical protein